MTERVCGGCTACCKTLPVPSISKKAGVWCEHCELGRGCKVNDHKPNACRNFRCMWLLGAGGEADRPDKTGVVTHVEVSPILMQKAVFLSGLSGLQSNSRETPYALKLTLVYLKQKLPVVHVGPDGSYQRVFFPSIDSSSRVDLATLEREGITTMVYKT